MRIENPKEAILAVQTYLYELGLLWDWLPTVYPSGEYGSQTKGAVEAVQSRFDLPVTGEVDFATWSLIYLAYRDAKEKRQIFPSPAAPRDDFPLQIGSRGYSVILLGATINALREYYTTLPRLSPTSLYQYGTASAVRKLQKIYRLEETGMVDIPLWNLIFADLASKERYSSSQSGEKDVRPRMARR